MGLQKPNRLAWLTIAAMTTVAVAAPSQARCIWGSFDGTRIEGAASVLSTGNFARLRSVINQNGGALGLATPRLTPVYLAQTDVFFTSLLSRRKGALTPPEVTAFRNWFNAGGTLVVTSDIHSHAAYDSFTKWLGVTGWTASQACRETGRVVKRHGVTLGVSSFYYCTIANFTLASNVQLLGNDAAGKPFLAVVNPTPTVKGRMVVLGDHNMFTDWFITNADNTALAASITRWACTPGCSATAAWSNYGTGLSGQHGIPSLVPSDSPIIGSRIDLLGGNSSRTLTNGMLIIGLSSDAAPLLGGSLLASLDLVVPVTVPASGLSLPVRVPSIGCGLSIFVQLLQTDPAARQSVSFTPGLRLAPGN